MKTVCLTGLNIYFNCGITCGKVFNFIKNICLTGVNKISDLNKKLN